MLMLTQLGGFGPSIYIDDTPGEISFTTPGSGMFVVPPGVHLLEEEVLGGGAGAPNAGATYSAGGAGGGGARRVRAVVPGQQIPYVVGDGGLGGTANQSGGTSSIGDMEMYATGGQPGGLGGQGYGGDVNGTGGNAGGVDGGGGNASVLGGGGGAGAHSLDGNLAGGSGAGGGGNGGNYVPTSANENGYAPGGGGAGYRSGYNPPRNGAAGRVKFRWGAGI